MPKLDNDRWEAFCHEYIKSFNGAKSYMAAYGTDNQATGRANAAKLLANASIKQRVDELKAERMEKLKIDAEWVLRRHMEMDALDVADILESDGSFKSVHDWPKAWRTSISGIDVVHLQEGNVQKIKWPDKVKNLELIGKHVDVQAYKDQVKTEHGFDDEVAVMMRDASKGDL